ncbi:ArnT family glycosyltransferase [Allobranchiibius huperziae]|uniref:4-amino-4-deoxy-L-arabinose transferase-like glycosyltransferase n=1 Tax=Allobranchiibius huperziae TaxID=1874116 RepID=A0A853DJM2_9MICO|nr:glycosyltransferase family 39 protein [Allobranchiibius huperziae]NYJ76149.1 4-amino-4-deoxy-L-arabinose transferase-like glycosyltransferase [Allobranchiibius huperziae]
MNSVTAHLRSSHTANAPTGRSGVGASRSSFAADRFGRVWRGPDGDPTWARPALFGLLVVTAAAYFYNLTASGWANSFYSAAAQAGSVNWEAFLFGSSDAANSITVDKPPAALWVMALSVRVFGLNSFAILMPQVLMGVGAVAVVYATVKRYFSAVGGLLAGAVLALTPIAVLMSRFNNPDALLTLLMALGGWATMRAIERGSAKWMIAVGVFIGFGFLTKTFQVFLVVPFFGIAYLVAANTTLRRRIVGAVAGLAAMVVSAGWWVAIVSLTPASMRPYIGGSQDNSFWNLTFGYNGFGRLSGNETGSVGGGGGGGNAGGQWGTTGITRMFGSEVGAQISWLIPTALILLGVGLVVRGWRPRTDLRRAFYLVWGGWLIVTGLTFSFMAGIFHQYYTVALAPAVATLVGAGAIEMWERRHTVLGTVTLAAATAAAAIWSFVLLTRVTAYGDWLRVSILAVGMAAALLLLAIRWMHARFVPFVIAAAVAAGLAGPTAYTVSTLAVGHSGSIVVAGPSGSGMGGMGGGFAGGARAAARAGGTTGGFAGRAPGGTTGGATAGGAPGGATAGTRTGGGMGGLLDASTPSTEVVAALQSNASKYTWAAAAIGSQNAAGLQLGSGEPVMPIGGFNGSDPSPTLAQFQAYVKAGRIHYFLASSGGGMGGGSGSGSSITSWVEAHYTKVTIGSTTFYDLTQPTSSS